MCLARGIGQVSYRSEEEFDERFGRGRQADEQPLEGGRYAVESYLEYHGEKLAWRFDANTYIVLSRAMNHHDVGRGRGGIAAALVAHHRRRDDRRHLVGPPLPAAAPARARRAASRATRASRSIQSISGHDGFLTESEAVGKVIARALADI